MHAKDREPHPAVAVRRVSHRSPEQAETAQHAVDQSGLLALQRRIGNAAVTRILMRRQSGVRDVLRTAGRPLDDRVRSDMEARLGADFSDVRVHTGADADASARAVQAQAYTSGSHVVFRHGGYDPSSAAGRHVLAHELTHVVQQRTGPVSGVETADGLSVSHPNDRFERAAEATATAAMAAPVQRTTEVESKPGSSRQPAAIQRRVGFEFEDAHWRPWRRIRRDRGALGRSLRGVRGLVSGLDDDIAEPAARKTVLHSGRNFRLEADDTPGPMMSNIEFVTDPFDETDAGVAALQATMAEIRAIVARLDPFAGRRVGPGEGYTVPFSVSERDYKERYVRHGEHQLSGSAGIEAKDVLLSGGAAGGALKMQATAGIPLADLPEVLERLGRDVPHETPEETAAREPDRKLIQDLTQPNEPLKVQGMVPDLARQVVGELRNHADLATPLAGDAAALTGFLAAVMLSLKLLQRPGGAGRPIKYRLTFLPRNSFAQMFEILPSQQRAALQAHPDALLDALLTVSNANPLLRSGSDAGLTSASPLIGPNPGAVRSMSAEGTLEREPISGVDAALATVTIRDWIAGITSGRDYLTPATMDKWLADQADVSKSDRENAVGALESFGTADRVDTRDDGEHLPLFETRAIAPLGAGVNLTLTQATYYAERILRLYQRIRELRRPS
jgi:hypothetical protein